MPCIYTVVRKVVRYETQASSKAQLIHVADVRAMSALCQIGDKERRSK
jgi:hypothetical protein